MMYDFVIAVIFMLILLVASVSLSANIAKQDQRVGCINGELIIHDNQVYKCVKVEMNDGI
jgi:Skp family chaperone for outer membrane proteins